MKAKFALLVPLMLMVGCAQSRGIQTIDTDKKWLTSKVHRVIDDHAGVACWIYSSGYGGGISCLPLEMTTLEGE